MTESENRHHYQQEDHELVDTSPWPQNPFMTKTNNIINSRNIVPFLNTSTNSMAQDFGFSWIMGTNNEYPIENFMTNELQRMATIKDEFSVAESYPKFLELLSCSPSSSIEDLSLHAYCSSYMKNDHLKQISYSNNNQDFLLTSFSNGCQIEGGQLGNDEKCSGGDRTFSQILPTINVSSLNQSSSSSSSSSSSAISSNSFDMNCFPALDLFCSPKFNGNFSHPSSLNTQNLPSLSHGLRRMHQPIHKPSGCPNYKISSVSTTSTDESSKRPASKYMNAMANHESVVPKKSKLDTQRPSSAPFQVRKEKLGDRIAAIQQLVAPFGKTDTASVLMEAIGYIKFLQTQVETLSVPYMKPTDKICGLSIQEGRMEDGKKEAKRDLRSRGLCLVPLSCFSNVTNGGDDIWPVSLY